MLNEVGDAKNINKYVARAKDKDDPFRLMGFGHRVYKNFDPRAKIIRQPVMTFWANWIPTPSRARYSRLRRNWKTSPFAMSTSLSGICIRTSTSTPALS